MKLWYVQATWGGIKLWIMQATWGGMVIHVLLWEWWIHIHIDWCEDMCDSRAEPGR